MNKIPSVEERVEEFIKLRVEKFQGIIEQHVDACDGEISQMDISDYFEEEIREIEKVTRHTARTQGKAEEREKIMECFC